MEKEKYQELSPEGVKEFEEENMTDTEREMSEERKREISEERKGTFEAGKKEGKYQAIEQIVRLSENDEIIISDNALDSIEYGGKKEQYAPSSKEVGKAENTMEKEQKKKSGKRARVFESGRREGFHGGHLISGWHNIRSEEDRKKFEDIEDRFSQSVKKRDKEIEEEAESKEKREGVADMIGLIGELKEMYIEGSLNIGWLGDIKNQRIIFPYRTASEERLLEFIGQIKRLDGYDICSAPEICTEKVIKAIVEKFPNAEFKDVNSKETREIIKRIGGKLA